MTLREAEDVATELKRVAWRVVERPLLDKAAEAIDWLLRELAEAETEIDYWRFAP